MRKVEKPLLSLPRIPLSRVGLLVGGIAAPSGELPMKRRIGKRANAGILCFLGVASVAHAGLITFEAPLPAGLTVNNFIQGSPVDPTAEITNQYENLGVIFTTASPGAPYAVLINLTGQAPSGVNGIGAANSSNDVDYTQDLDIFLVVPGTLTPAVTDTFSIQGDEIPIPGNVIFTAYDVNGVQIASGTLPDAAGQTYSLSAPGIHEFRIHSQSGTVAYDNVSFDTPVAPPSNVSGVPEPATFGLIALGIAAIAFARLRRAFSGQRAM
jgi:hypothetical protein